MEVGGLIMARAVGLPLRRHDDPHGHGRWFAMLPAATMLELKASPASAQTDTTPLVPAKGRMISPGRQSSTATGPIVGLGDKLPADASIMCLVLEQVPAGPH